MNTVCIPGTPIHQHDKDVSHAPGACQDQPWCWIANAFIHPLQTRTQCSDMMINFTDHFYFSLRNINTELCWLLHHETLISLVAGLFLEINTSLSVKGFLVKEICFVNTERICFTAWLWPAVSNCGTIKCDLSQILRLLFKVTACTQKVSLSLYFLNF